MVINSNVIAWKLYFVVFPGGMITQYKGIMKICVVSYKFAFPGDIL